MSGFLGLPTGGQKAATGNLQNVFNYGMSAGKTGEAAGQRNLGDASSYFKELLTGGRTKAAINAAPVVNAVQGQADTAKREEAATGTGRGGGTAGANREASTTTAKTIDDIINQNLIGGKAKAAEGLSKIGDTQLYNAENLLGLGTRAETEVLSSAEKQAKQQAEFGANIAKAALAVAFL